jgi:hypothetical protein
MKDIDFDTSNRIATLVGAEVGLCATNVAIAFLQAKAEMPDQSQYIEGLWWIGGQVVLHAWIETDDSIIDPTLAVSSKSLLREKIGHYPIERYSEDEFLKHLREEAFTLRSRRELGLTWDDPRVEALRKKIDPP